MGASSSDSTDVPVRALLAAPAETRRSLLADAVVELGPSLVEALRKISNAPGEERSGLDRTLATQLAAEASDVLSTWLTGVRISVRADERERRVVTARRLAEAHPEDPLLTRLAIDAMLRLPPSAPGRDLTFARDRLCAQVELGRCKPAHLDDWLVATFYLLHHELLAPRESAALIEETVAAAVAGHPDPVAVRDVFRAAHDYCITRAGDLILSDGDEFARWMHRAQLLLEQAAHDEAVTSAQLAAMTARQADLAEDLPTAIEAYARVVDSGDVDTATVQAAALSEATLRLLIGDSQRLVDRLEPLLTTLTDRYLTAVTDCDIDAAGFTHARAVTLVANALVHLGRVADALELVDVSKSLRLRYRSALSRHPACTEVVTLERDILALDRGGEPAMAEADEQSLPARVRLLERFRRLRPDLRDSLSARTVAEIAAALAPTEGAVLLAGLVDSTLVSLVTARAEMTTVLLEDWPWERWEKLLADAAWLRILAGDRSVDGRQALARVVDAAEPTLGRVIRRLVDRHAGGVQRLAFVPHRRLHLIPYWALPSLAEVPVVLYTSADELVTARSRGPGPLPGTWLVVVNPTGDLPCSPSEAQSVARLGPPRVLGADAASLATIPVISAALDSAAALHFSGHAYSDHRNPDRSALLVAADVDITSDPFPGWVTRAGPWRVGAAGWRTADVPGVGRLAELQDPTAEWVERRLERGAAPTLRALYAGGRLRSLGELWSAADMLVSGEPLRCRFAFLSACQSGVAGGVTSDVDEYGGLPAVFRLAGADTVVCSLWPVDEGFSALFVDAFYTELAAGADLVTAVRAVGGMLRNLPKAEVLTRLDRLADRVRIRSPRAAFALEGYRARIDGQPAAHPYAGPWDWASFYTFGASAAAPGDGTSRGGGDAGKPGVPAVYIDP